MVGRIIQLLPQPMCLYLEKTEGLLSTQDLAFSCITTNSLLDYLDLFRILRLKFLLLWAKILTFPPGQSLGWIQNVWHCHVDSTTLILRTLRYTIWSKHIQIGILLVLINFCGENVLGNAFHPANLIHWSIFYKNQPNHFQFFSF